jgi:hypothetical protein
VRFEWYKLESGSGSIGRVVSRKKVAVAVVAVGGSGVTSGSGWVAVGPNDSGDQGGSNGVS